MWAKKRSYVQEGFGQLMEYEPLWEQDSRWVTVLLGDKCRAQGHRCTGQQKSWCHWLGGRKTAVLQKQLAVSTGHQQLRTTLLVLKTAPEESLCLALKLPYGYLVRMSNLTLAVRLGQARWSPYPLARSPGCKGKYIYKTAKLKWDNVREGVSTKPDTQQMLSWGQLLRFGCLCHPKMCMLEPIAQCDSIYKWSHWELIKSWGLHPNKWDQSPSRKASSTLPFLRTSWGHGKCHLWEMNPSQTPYLPAPWPWT